MRVEAVDPARTRQLRRAVLRPNLAADDPLPGDDLTGAVHLAAIEGEAVIGTCFIYPAQCPWRPADQPSWRLRQMATAPEHRGGGAGAAMLDGAIGYIAEHGGGTLWLEARERAVSLYARHGLEREGGIFVHAEHTIPHQRMWRQIKGEPRAAPTSSK